MGGFCETAALRALNVVGWKCAVGALSCYSVKVHHALMGHMV